MSDPEEEDDVLEDADSGVGDGDGSIRDDEEEEEEVDFFDTGQDTASHRLSLHVASESCQRRGGTEDDLIGPITPSTALTIGGGGSISRKVTKVDFSHTISLDLADLNNEEWADPTIPAMPLETMPPACPPPITEIKLSSSIKSQKRKELVVESEDGFVREGAVPCGCTQATRMASALKPLTIFFLQYNDD